MKKLLIVNLLSLLGAFACGIYLILSTKDLSQNSMKASDFVDTVHLPLIFMSLCAFAFWASIIIALFIFLKKLITKETL